MTTPPTDPPPLTLATMQREVRYTQALSQAFRLGGWIYEQLLWVDLLIGHEDLLPQPGDLGRYLIHVCDCGCDTTEPWIPGHPGPTDTIHREIEWLRWMQNLEQCMWEDIEDEFPDLHDE